MVAVLQPVGDEKYIAIDRAVVLVGRSAECDAIISTSKKISRRHCCLVQVDESYFVRDLGSMNGVWLNGARVNRETQINTGDKVSIGDVEYLFHANARVEQKSAGGQPPAATALDESPQASPQDDVELVMNIDDVVEKTTTNEEYDIVDDVIPLADDEIWETNEVEVVDEDDDSPLPYD